MSLWQDLADVVSGQPVGSTAAQQALSDQLDSTIAANQQSDIANGLYTQAQLDAANAPNGSGLNVDDASEIIGAAATGAVDAAGNPVQVLSTGLQAEGQVAGQIAGQVIGGATSGAGSLLSGVLKNIPWWIWLAGAGAIFVWMGGLELLEGSLSRGRRS